MLLPVLHFLPFPILDTLFLAHLMDTGFPQRDDPTNLLAQDLVIGHGESERLGRHGRFLCVGDMVETGKKKSMMF